MARQPDPLTPHDVDAEEAVLATLLVEPDAVWKVAPELAGRDFYRTANGWIYDAIVSLAMANVTPNQITVSHELARRNRLEDIGGAAYLSRLVTELPTTVGVEHYAGIVRSTKQRTNLIDAAQKIANIAYRGEQESDELQASALQLILEAVPGRTNGHRSLDEIFAEWLNDSGPRPGVRLGFGALDQAIGGLAPGDVLLVAAQTSVGKTAFALNIARNVALQQGKHVAIFSVEMSTTGLAIRLLALQTGIPMNRLINGWFHADLTDSEQSRVNSAIGRITDAGIEVLDSVGWTVEKLAVEARRIHAQRHIDLLIIDYLQLLSTRARAENETQEVARISRAVKEVARALPVPVIAVSQLNRSAEESSEPQLRHLLQSGALERDADIVLFLHWTDREKRERRPVHAIIAKNRNGPLRRSALELLAPIGRFIEPGAAADA